MVGLTPEEAVKLAADRFSRRFFWATIVIVGAAWAVGVAAVATVSYRLAGIAALLLVPAAGTALVSMAFQSQRLRQDIADKIRPKFKP